MEPANKSMKVNFGLCGGGNGIFSKSAKRSCLGSPSAMHSTVIASRTSCGNRRSAKERVLNPCPHRRPYHRPVNFAWRERAHAGAFCRWKFTWPMRGLIEETTKEGGRFSGEASFSSYALDSVVVEGQSRELWSPVVDCRVGGCLQPPHVQRRNWRNGHERIVA